MTAPMHKTSSRTLILVYAYSTFHNNQTGSGGFVVLLLWLLLLLLLLLMLLWETLPYAMVRLLSRIRYRSIIVVLHVLLVHLLFLTTAIISFSDAAKQQEEQQRVDAADIIQEAECSADGTCQTTTIATATATTASDEESSSTSTSTSTSTASRTTRVVVFCQDSDPSVCEYLSSVGECQTNANWMKTFCQKSCGICNNIVADSKNKKNDKDDKMSVNNNHDFLQVGMDLGIAQRIVDKNITPEQIQARLELARSHYYSYYYYDDDDDHDDPKKTNTNNIQLLRLCRNTHEVCTIWAIEGECERNPTYMKKECAPVCLACEELEITPRTTTRTRTTTTTTSTTTTKNNMDDDTANHHHHAQQQSAHDVLVETLPFSCPLDPTVPNALRPGDLDKLFRRIVKDNSDRGLQILSSPDITVMDNTRTTKHKILSDTTSSSTTANKNKDAKEEIMANDGGPRPWVIMMDNFITPEEAERLIELGNSVQGYEASSMTTTGDVDDRSSTTAWCRDPSCTQDPIAKRVLQRIEDLTGIPERNYEYLQLLKYETGIFDNRQHDFIVSHREKQPGVRILTVLLYLNEVKAGGQTNLFELGITIEPKVGRMVLWPNVQNENPHEPDKRTQYQSLLLVEEGPKKYAAIACWIHQRDYKTADANGCTTTTTTTSST